MFSPVSLDLGVAIAIFLWGGALNAPPPMADRVNKLMLHEIKVKNVAFKIFSWIQYQTVHFSDVLGAQIIPTIFTGQDPVLLHM